MSNVAHAVEVYDQDDNWLTVTSVQQKVGAGLVVHVEIEALASRDEATATLARLADLTDGMPFDGMDDAEQLIARALRRARALQDALHIILGTGFPVEDEARVAWVRQTFDIARAALDSRGEASGE